MTQWLSCRVSTRSAKGRCLIPCTCFPSTSGHFPIAMATALYTVGYVTWPVYNLYKIILKRKNIRFYWTYAMPWLSENQRLRATSRIILAVPLSIGTLKGFCGRLDILGQPATWTVARDNMSTRQPFATDASPQPLSDNTISNRTVGTVCVSVISVHVVLVYSSPYLR